MQTYRTYIAKAPSNIALIKYWGKRDEALQWPANDSLSMTLSSAYSQTQVQCLAGEEGGDDITLQGTKVPRMQHGALSKLHKHLDFLRQEVGINGRLKVETWNSFPMSCGIASSASGYAALTLAAAAALNQVDSIQDLKDQGLPAARLAHLARLGSGSAGRSLFGGYVEWCAGAYPEIQKVMPLVSDYDFPLADVICILSGAEKSVSSSVAHRAAWSSPLFAPRLAGLKDRIDAVKLALAQRDLDALGPLVEAEALEMHAVIMSATPAVNYLTEETSRFLAWVRQQRRSGSLPAYFTIDAGPNVHLLCRPGDRDAVAAAVQQAFQGVRILIDQTGDGPSLAVLDSALPWPSSDFLHLVQQTSVIPSHWQKLAEFDGKGPRP